MHIREFFFPSIDSTQSFAKKHHQTFSPKGLTVICAEAQSVGKGRLQRPWFSPKGKNLYLTFYFCLPQDTSDLASLAIVASLTLALLLQKKGFHPKMKWPNDLLLSGKKVSGILCETSIEDSLCHCFIGIGLNVNMEKKLLSSIDQPATSLKIENKKRWNRKKLLKELEKLFVKNLRVFSKEGFLPFYSLANSLLAFKGKKVILEGAEKSEQENPTLIGISPKGALLLLFPDGKKKTLFSGDVFAV